MLEIIEWITIILSTYLAIKSFSFLNRSSRYFIHLFFYLLLVAPLFLDYVIGIPEYTDSYYYGFRVSSQDTNTRIIYCIFVVISQFIILKKDKRSEIKNTVEYVNNQDIEKYRGIKATIATLMMLPSIIVVVFIRNFYILYTWGWRYLSNSIVGTSAYCIAEWLSYLAIAAAIMSICYIDKYPLYRFFSCVMLYFNVCIEGKRAILFFVLVVFYATLSTRSRGNNKLRKIVYSAIVALFAVISLLMSFSIQSQYRGIISDLMYQTLRIDYFRDDTVRMAIYGLLNPNEIQIYEYFGQGIITEVGYLFPLNMIPLIKKVGYETMFTSAMSRISIDQLGTGRMTVSIFDNMIANFGVFGLIFAPIFMRYISKYIDKQRSYWKPLLLGGVILFMMFSFSYIAWYWEFLLIAILYKKKIRLVIRRGGK